MSSSPLTDPVFYLIVGVSSFMAVFIVLKLLDDRNGEYRLVTKTPQSYYSRNIIPESPGKPPERRFAPRYQVNAPDSGNGASPNWGSEDSMMADEFTIDPLIPEAKRRRRSLVKDETLQTIIPATELSYMASHYAFLLCPKCHKPLQHGGLRRRITPLNQFVIVETIHSTDECGEPVFRYAVKNTQFSPSMLSPHAVQSEIRSVGYPLRQQSELLQTTPQNASPPTPSPPPMIYHHGPMPQEEVMTAVQPEGGNGVMTPPAPPPSPTQLTVQQSGSSPIGNITVPTLLAGAINPNDADGFNKFLSGCASCPHFDDMGKRCVLGHRKPPVYPTTPACMWWKNERVREALLTGKIRIRGVTV